LVVLSRDVEGKILTVNNPLCKSQVVGKKLSALLFNKHLSGVEMDINFVLLHCVFLVVSWGEVNERFDCKRNICGIVESVLVRDLGFSNVFIELLILVISDLSLVSVPDSLQSVDVLSIELNWVGNKKREFSQDSFYFSGLRKVPGLGSQSQFD